VGWLWYLGTLVPVIGIVHMGGLAMSDHYAYVPLIGLYVIAAWGLEDFFRYLEWGRIAPSIFAAAIVSALMICTGFQISHWRNTVVLQKQAVKVTGSHKAHYNLGLALMKEGRLREAVAHFSKAIEIKPDYSRAFNNIGIALMRLEKFDEAIDNYLLALRINPKLPEAYYNLGVALMKQDKLDEAIGQFRKALQVMPNYPRARRALAMASRQKMNLSRHRTLPSQHQRIP